MHESNPPPAAEPAQFTPIEKIQNLPQRERELILRLMAQIEVRHIRPHPIFKSNPITIRRSPAEYLAELRRSMPQWAWISISPAIALTADEAGKTDPLIHYVKLHKKHAPILVNGGYIAYETRLHAKVIFEDPDTKEIRQNIRGLVGRGFPYQEGVDFGVQSLTGILLGEISRSLTKGSTNFVRVTRDADGRITVHEQLGPMNNETFWQGEGEYMMEYITSDGLQYRAVEPSIITSMKAYSERVKALGSASKATAELVTQPTGEAPAVAPAVEAAVAEVTP